MIRRIVLSGLVAGALVVSVRAQAETVRAPVNREAAGKPEGVAPQKPVDSGAKAAVVVEPPPPPQKTTPQPTRPPVRKNGKTGGTRDPRNPEPPPPPSKSGDAAK